MSTRTVGPGAGWGWLRQAINLGSHRPMAIFGGAALVFGVVVVMAIVLGLLTAATASSLLQTGGAPSMLVSLLITLPILLVMAALMVGYLRIIDAVEHSRPAVATGVFAGFGDWPTTLRIFGFMLVIAAAQNVILGGIVALLAPEVGAWYMQVLANPAANPAEVSELPSGFGTVFAALWIISLFAYAVQAIGFGQIALGRRGVGGALMDGLAGAAKNLLPLVVLMLVAIAAAIAIGLVLLLLMFIVGLLAKVAGAWILFLIGAPLYFALVIAMIVVSFGTMYFMWRDICSDEAVQLQDADNQVHL